MERLMLFVVGLPAPLACSVMKIREERAHAYQRKGVKGCYQTTQYLV
jgi:hypothetical protein